MPIETISHPNVAEMAFEQMKDLITSGEWKAGERIPPEIELAKMMGVSRVSIRAALQNLASLGIVTRQQGKGTVVCSMSGEQQINGLVSMLVLEPPDLQAMNEYRMILECGSAELAATRCDESVISKLRENLGEMKKLSESGEDTAEVDVEFHMLIAEATLNPMVIKTYEIMKKSFLSCMRVYKRIIDIRTGIYYHTKLIEALNNHDSFGAKRIMEEHLQKNESDIQRVVQEQTKK